MPDSETPKIEVQKNNPLHGVKLEVLLTELVDPLLLGGLGRCHEPQLLQE